MATQAEITLKIKVDKGEAEKNLNSITQELNDVRKAQTDLNNAFKTGNIGADEYSKKMNELREKTQQLQAQQTLATKVIVAQKGSINELSNALALNKNAYNALSAEQRENANVGGKLKKTIQDQQSSLGDLTKSVGGGGGLRGGITAAFKGMASSLGAAGLAFISVNGAAQVFKRGIAQSGDASDKLDQTLAGIRGTLSQMAGDLIDMNFEGFFSRAAQGGRAAKEAMANAQELGDLTLLSDQHILDKEKEIIEWKRQNSLIAKKDRDATWIANNDSINQNLKLIGLRRVELADQKNINVLRQLTQDPRFGDFAPEIIETYTKAIKGLSIEESIRYNKAAESYGTYEKDLKKIEDLQAAEKSGELINKNFLNQLIKTNEKSKTVYEQDLKDFDDILQKKGQSAETFINDIVGRPDLQLIGKKLFDILPDASTVKEGELSKELIINSVNAVLAATNAASESSLEIDQKNANAKAKLRDEDISAANAAKAEQEKIDADRKKALEEFQQWRRDYEFAKVDITREANEKLKEANREYNEWLFQSEYETRQINIEAEENGWEREHQRIQLDYEYKLEDLDKNRQILLDKLKDDEDYSIKKLAIDNKYKQEKLALEKNKTQIEKELALESAQMQVDVMAAMAGDIMTILTSLDSESRGLKYAALIVDSATAIADVFINFEIAKAKGFGSMGPILGIPAAVIMEVKKWVSIGSIVAKTAYGLSQINSAGKERIGNEKPERNNSNVNGRFALGGWIGGGSHQDGGVNINAEGGEFVVNKRAMMNPQIASFVNQANQYGNGGGNLGGMLTEERVAQIATSVLGAVPVYIVESEMTGIQRKVQIRESKFVK